MMTRAKGPYPPIILLAFILAQIGLHKWLPVATIVPPPWHWAGAGFVALGVFIVVGPVRAFSRAETTIKPFQDSSTLVRGGMYRFTHNPMYLGMLTVLTGIALLCGSLTPFVAPVLFVPVLNVRVIRHEEAMLEEAFGDEYLAFKRDVRRWI